MGRKRKGRSGLDAAAAAGTTLERIKEEHGNEQRVEETDAALGAGGQDEGQAGEGEAAENPGAAETGDAGTGAVALDAGVPTDNDAGLHHAASTFNGEMEGLPAAEFDAAASAAVEKLADGLPAATVDDIMIFGTGLARVNADGTLEHVPLAGWVPRWQWEDNLRDATFAASYAFGDRGDFAGIDVDDDATTEDGTLHRVMQAAASFVRANPDAPADAIPIHLARQKLAVPQDDPRAAVAWKVFRFTLLELDAFDRAQAPKPAPEPVGGFGDPRGHELATDPFAPVGLGQPA